MEVKASCIAELAQQRREYDSLKADVAELVTKVQGMFVTEFIANGHVLIVKKKPGRLSRANLLAEITVVPYSEVFVGGEIYYGEQTLKIAKRKLEKLLQDA